MEDVTHHKWISLSPTKLQLYGHFSNTDTSILWTVSNVPTKFSYIFFKILSLIRTMDTKSWPQRVNSYKLKYLFITDAVVIR